MKTEVSTHHDLDEISGGDSLRLGTQAGPWIIQRELGRGGMGVVYEAVHAQIGKRAALKVMRLGSQQLDSNVHRMELEAQVVNAIRHPNIVDIFDVGTTNDGRPYIVMELLTGGSLNEAEGGWGIREAIAILRQVCEALIAAHAAGVVHRDLKPENIFVAKAGGSGVFRVVLLDWGIARMVHAEHQHTLEGQFVGTPRYIAPEQARGEMVTSKTDVYSLGVVAYELFLLRPPFDAESAAEVMAMHLLLPPRPPRELWPEIPATLDRLLQQMLAKEPAARPTVLEVVTRLAQIEGDLDEARASPPEAPTSRGPATVEHVAPPLTEPTSNGAVEGRDSVVGPRSRRLGARQRGAIAALAVAAVAAFAVGWIRHAVPKPRGPTARGVPPAASPVESRVEVPRAAPIEPRVGAPPPVVTSVTAPRAAPPPPAARPLDRSRAPALVNPVLEDCSDPAVLRDGARWYMTCTRVHAGNLFPIYESADLQSWQPVGWIFPAGHKPTWASGNYWSPELHPTPTGVAAYFSMRVSGARNAIGVATATTIDGPYDDIGSPLVAPSEGASDAHVLVDGNRRYLYFRSEGPPSSIQVQALAADGVTTDGEPVRVLDATEAWEHNNVEAPWVVHAAGYYYLFYTGSRYCDVTYAIGVARATTPFGPFQKRPDPIVLGDADWLAPGHAAVTDGPGNQRYLAYHAYRATEGEPSCESTSEHNTRRHAKIERLRFERGWPHVSDPTAPIDVDRK